MAQPETSKDFIRTPILFQNCIWPPILSLNHKETQNFKNVTKNPKTSKNCKITIPILNFIKMRKKKKKKLSTLIKLLNDDTFTFYENLTIMFLIVFWYLFAWEKFLDKFQIWDMGLLPCYEVRLAIEQAIYRFQINMWSKHVYLVTKQTLSK